MKNLLIIVALLNSLILLSQTSSSTVKKQGYWKQKDPKTNKIIFEGEFNDDKPNGGPSRSNSVKALLDDSTAIWPDGPFNVQYKGR